MQFNNFNLLNSSFFLNKDILKKKLICNFKNFFEKIIISYSTKFNLFIYIKILIKYIKIQLVKYND